MGLVTKLKEYNQDFEWYPTTNEMLACVRSDKEDGTRLMEVKAFKNRNIHIKFKTFIKEK